MVKKTATLTEGRREIFHVYIVLYHGSSGISVQNLQLLCYKLLYYQNVPVRTKHTGSSFTFVSPKTVDLI